MKRAIAFLLIISTVFAVCGCRVLHRPTNPYEDIYIVSNTESILINEMPRISGEEELKISMAKNEAEAAQFIIRSEQNVYENLKLTVSDLKCGDDALSCVELFREYYTQEAERFGEYVDKSNSIPTPNALIPMEYDDLNVTTTKLNENTAYYLRVTTDEATVPGVYSGKITLAYDGGSMEIPVSVTVWDITLPKTPTYGTIFLLWETFFEDYTGWKKGTEKYEDNFNKIMELLNAYKVSPSNVIDGRDATDNSIDAKVKAIAETFEKYPGFTIFNPTFSLTDTNNHEQIYISDANKAYNLEYFGAVMKYGLQDKCLVSVDDEPSNPWQFKKMKVTGEFLNEYFPEIKQYITCNRKDGFANGIMDYWCPIVASYDRNYAQGVTQNEGSQYWWYFCNETPAPTSKYYSDMSQARISGWMAKDWNIHGLLYWILDLYMHYNGQTGGYEHLQCPIWDTEQYFYQGMEGDGVINRDLPVGSLLLEGVRDSVEDYDLALLLENAVAKKVEELDLSLTLDEAMQSYYDGLYQSIREFPTYQTPDNFAVLREHVAEDIINGVGYIMTQNKLGGTGKFDEKHLTFHTSPNATLSVNGQPLVADETTATYSRFTFNYFHTDPYEILTVEVNGKEYKRPIISEETLVEGVQLVDFSDTSVIEAIKEANASRNIDVEAVERDGETVLKVTYNDKYRRIEIPALALKTHDTSFCDEVRFAYSADGTNCYNVMSSVIYDETNLKTSSTIDVYLKEKYEQIVSIDADRTIQAVGFTAVPKALTAEKFSIYVSSIYAVLDIPYKCETLDDIRYTKLVETAE